MSIDVKITILDMHSDPLSTIRENVERLIALHGITSDQDLAERAGVDQSTIWKLRKSNPPKQVKLSTLEGVATAFKIAVWQLAMPNLAIGTKSVEELRGGISERGFALCATFHALPEHARRELLSYAAYSASQLKVTSPAIDELRGLLGTA